MSRRGEPATVVVWKEVAMGSIMHPSRSDSTWRRYIADQQVKLALVTALCLIVEAVVAKNVLDVELDWFSQLAPFWVFIAYMVSGLRDRASEIGFKVAIVGSTVAVLALYAL
jgi:hypothetical protein